MTKRLSNANDCKSNAGNRVRLAVGESIQLTTQRMVRHACLNHPADMSEDRLTFLY